MGISLCGNFNSKVFFFVKLNILSGHVKIIYKKVFIGFQLEEMQPEFWDYLRLPI